MSRRLVLIWVALWLGWCRLLFWGFFQTHTWYAPDYSEARFDRLRQGMSRAEVLAVLGEPLSRETERAEEQWCYLHRGMRCFTISADVFLGFETREELRQISGEPLRTWPQGKRERLDYSRPLWNDTNWELRAVVIQEDTVRFLVTEDVVD